MGWLATASNLERELNLAAEKYHRIAAARETKKPARQHAQGDDRPSILIRFPFTVARK